MIHGETVHSPLPMDLPWWMPDHFVFFGVLYAVLGIIGLGLAYTIFKSWNDAKSADHQAVVFKNTNGPVAIHGRPIFMGIIPLTPWEGRRNEKD